MQRVRAHSIRDRGLPENFVQMVLRGVSLDAIIEDEDRVKERGMNWGMKRD